MIDTMIESPTRTHSEKIDSYLYLEFVKTLQGHPIKTQGKGKVFRVVVEGDQMKFIPQSTLPYLGCCKAMASLAVGSPTSVLDVDTLITA